MRLTFERSGGRVRDAVLVEPDGTVFTSFAKTGFLRAATRTRFAGGTAAATGAFSISRGQAQASDTGAPAQQANHGLVFVSEIDGEEKIALIERFAGEDDARRALAMIDAALRRHVLAQRRMKGWRSLVCWAGAPFVAFLVAMSSVQFLNSHNAAFEELSLFARAAQGGPPAQALSAVSLPTAAAAAPAQLSMTSPAPAGANPPIDAAASAPRAPMPVQTRAMASVHFGLDNQPPQKTLYVYSDPNCPACRRFEAHIDDLARDFSIYVLPVAYQDGSWAIASQILCAADTKQGWLDAMKRATTTGAVAGEACERGRIGLRANMNAFESLGFDSTPRVVDGNGTVFPAGATAGAIRLKAAAR